MKEININGSVMKCYPLNAAQKIHFFTIQKAPPQLLCIGVGLYIKQDIDFDYLRKVVRQTYQRFDTMRLRFIMDEEDKQVYQYIVPDDDRELEYWDFSNWKQEDIDAELEKWTAVPFERFNSPMNRVVMVKMPDGFNGVYLKVDHMTMDSSSIVGFCRAILETYSIGKYDMKIKQAPVMRFIPQLEKDLAYEAGSRAQKRDEAFWAAEAAKSEPIYTGFTGQGELLRERAESGDPNRRYVIPKPMDVSADIAVFELEAEPSERLMKFCAENEVTMTSLLLMGMRTVLSKFNDNEKDVSIRSAVARRGDISSKYSGGTRVHFFAVRTIMEPEMTFLDGIKMIQAEHRKIYLHANYDPVRYLGMRSAYYSKNPAARYECITLTYQPLAAMKDTPDMPTNIPYQSRWYTNGVAVQPLYLTVMHRPEDNGLNFNFEYQKACVTREEMEYFYYYLCRVLFKGIEDKKTTIGDIIGVV